MLSCPELKLKVFWSKKVTRKAGISPQSKGKQPCILLVETYKKAFLPIIHCKLNLLIIFLARLNSSSVQIPISTKVTQLLFLMCQRGTLWLQSGRTAMASLDKSLLEELAWFKPENCFSCKCSALWRLHLHVHQFLSFKIHKIMSWCYNTMHCEENFSTTLNLEEYWYKNHERNLIIK